LVDPGTGTKKAGAPVTKITEVISLKSGLGNPWENFIPEANYTAG